MRVYEVKHGMATDRVVATSIENAVKVWCEEYEITSSDIDSITDMGPAMMAPIPVSKGK